MDRVFHALADGTRRGMLREMAKGEPTVAELGRPFPISAPAISKHLKVLEGAGLVTRIREGTTNRFRLNLEPFEAAHGVIEQLTFYWQQRLDALAELVEKPNEEDNDDE